MAVTTIPTAGIANDAVDNTKLDLASNYAFTGTVTGAGKVLQVVHVESNSAISSSSTIPADTSVPTLSTTFTSLNASSTLYFFVTVFCNEDINAGDNIALPIFKGTSLIGIGYHHSTGPNGENFHNAKFTVKHTPASTAQQTYSLRGGMNNGTFESLGTASYMSGTYYGQNLKNTMTIMEVL
jgi:hypothetical protein